MIYFLTPFKGGPIKIGTTTQLSKRLAYLQCEHKTALTVLGVMDGGRTEEEAIHERFAANRQHKEWFAPADDLWAFIRDNARPWEGNNEDDKVDVRLRMDADFAQAIQAEADRDQIAVAAFIRQVVAKELDRRKAERGRK